MDLILIVVLFDDCSKCRPGLKDGWLLASTKIACIIKEFCAAGARMALRALKHQKDAAKRGLVKEWDSCIEPRAFNCSQLSTLSGFSVFRDRPVKRALEEIKWRGKFSLRTRQGQRRIICG